jgi:hypothetical protein
MSRGLDRAWGAVRADASLQQRAQEVAVVVGRLGRVYESFDYLDEAIWVVVEWHVTRVFEDL